MKKYRLKLSFVSWGTEKRWSKGKHPNFTAYSIILRITGKEKMKGSKGRSKWENKRIHAILVK